MNVLKDTVKNDPNARTLIFEVDGINLSYRAHLMSLQFRRKEFQRKDPLKAQLGPKLSWSKMTADPVSPQK